MDRNLAIARVPNREVIGIACQAPSVAKHGGPSRAWSQQVSKLLYLYANPFEEGDPRSLPVQWLAVNFSLAIIGTMNRC
jgi:hypothetical protein